VQQQLQLHLQIRMILVLQIQQQYHKRLNHHPQQLNQQLLQQILMNVNRFLMLLRHYHQLKFVIEIKEFNSNLLFLQ
jgi:hypothetical protein